MAVTGRPPKDNARNRVAKVHDWTEVVDLPWDGYSPDLPSSYRIATQDGAKTVVYLAVTKQWWEVVRSVPHAAMWTPGDWQSHLTTARIHDLVHRGDTPRAAELRIRENDLGLTAAARRNLRIRYVAPPDVETTTEPAPKESKGAGTVTSLSSRRERLTADAS